MKGNEHPIEIGFVHGPQQTAANVPANCINTRRLQRCQHGFATFQGYFPLGGIAPHEHSHAPQCPNQFGGCLIRLNVVVGQITHLP